jgi:hypothetical protein
MGQDHLGLGGLAGLARLDLDDLDGAETERAARSGGALGVVLRQQGFGSPAQAVDGQKGDLQFFAGVMCGESTDQIFSML